MRVFLVSKTSQQSAIANILNLTCILMRSTHDTTALHFIGVSIQFYFLASKFNSLCVHNYLSASPLCLFSSKSNQISPNETRSGVRLSVGRRDEKRRYFGHYMVNE